MRDFKVRDISGDSDSPTWDIIFTGSDGIQRYSEEVWYSAADAEKAKENYANNKEFNPDHWESLT